MGALTLGGNVEGGGCERPGRGLRARGARGRAGPGAGLTAGRAPVIAHGAVQWRLRIAVNQAAGAQRAAGATGGKLAAREGQYDGRAREERKEERGDRSDRG